MVQQKGKKFGFFELGLTQSCTQVTLNPFLCYWCFFHLKTHLLNQSVFMGEFFRFNCFRSAYWFQMKLRSCHSLVSGLVRSIRLWQFERQRIAGRTTCIHVNYGSQKLVDDADAITPADRLMFPKINSQSAITSSTRKVEIRRQSSTTLASQDDDGSGVFLLPTDVGPPEMAER